MRKTTTAIARSLMLVSVLGAARDGARADPPDPVEKHGHEARHGGRRFKDAAAWAKQFEDPARDRWQRPAAVIAALKLRGDERVLEIGSGTGYFAVRLARAVPRGRVLGVDIEASMTRYLEKRAAKESLSNLRAITGTATEPRLTETVDLVFTCNTYHHLADRPSYFRRLAGRLRHGARLVVVDFKGGRLPLGPPEGERVLPAQLDRELTSAGFARVSLDEKTLPHQYLATYRPVPPVLPRAPDRACVKDADCALRGRTPCTCPICSNRWREPINQAALAAWRSAWARRRCAMPRCAECPIAGEWLGTRAVCRRGQCAVE